MHHFRKTTKHYDRANAKDKLRSECTFCTEETRENIIDENETMFIVPNRVSYDLFEGLRIDDHLLIIPKRHIKTLEELTVKERQDFAELLIRYEGKGYSFYGRGITNINRSVKHQHTHLLKIDDHKKTRLQLYLDKPYVLVRF
jgi:diadenosine tetraphosphate (Ap4A) HIT family hydrolase